MASRIKMSNWYQQQKSKKQDYTRYLALIKAEIFLSPTSQEETELETANNILQKVLSKVEGDASFHTGIDSKIRFQIGTVTKI